MTFKKIQIVGIIVIVALLGGTVFFFANQTQSVVGFSEISLQTIGGEVKQVGVAALTIDGINPVANLIRKEDVSQGDFEAKQSVQLTFIPESKPTCTLPLKKTVKKSFSDIVYYEPASSSYSLDAPMIVNLAVTKDGFSFFDVDEKKINLKTADTVFLNSGDAEVRINRLGTLNLGEQCPFTDVAVVGSNIDGTGDLKVVRLSSLENQIIQLDTLVQSGVVGSINALRIFYSGNIFDSLSVPSGFTSGENLKSLDRSEIVFELKGSQSTNLVTAEFDPELFDIVFLRGEGVPQLSVSPSFLNVDAEQTASLTATVQNTGSSGDSFRIRIEESSSNISVSNPVRDVFIPQGQRQSVDFLVNGISGGSFDGEISAQAIESGRIDFVNFSGEVKQTNGGLSECTLECCENVPNTKNKFCSQGFTCNENNKCEEGTKPPKLVCEIWQSKIVSTQNVPLLTLFGIGIGDSGQTTETETCTTDLGVIGFGLGVVLIIVLGIVLITRRKKR